MLAASWRSRFATSAPAASGMFRGALAPPMIGLSYVTTVGRRFTMLDLRKFAPFQREIFVATFGALRDLDVYMEKFSPKAGR